MTINFQEVPRTQSGIKGKGNRTYGGAWGDFNGDNYPDLWVNNHGQPGVLYLNNGDGTFKNVTNQVFVKKPTGDEHGTAWIDFDNDGDQDLIQIVGGGKGLRVGPEFANRLYVNNGGKLEELANSLGVDYPLARGRSPLWLDFNNDGLLDLIVGAIPRQDNLEAPPKIFQQNSDGTFEDASAITGFELDSAPISFLSDLSRDGNLDLTAKSDIFRVYDIKSIPFIDITSQTIPSSVLTFNLATADFNNDLLPDIYLTKKVEGDSDFEQAGKNKILSILQAEKNEKGISLNTSGEITFDLIAQGYSSVPLNQVYIGTEGINPTAWEFTLSPKDPDVVGIFPHTPGVDRGIYIGYNPNLQRWDLLLSNPAQSMTDEELENPNMLIAFIDTNQTIVNTRAIGFQANSQPPGDQLLINTAQGLIDKSEEAGINTIPINGYSVVAGDFDNDMDQDIYIVTTSSLGNTPNILYENQGDGTFILVPNAGGAAGTDIGQGDFVMTADYDLDGFLDLFVANGGGPRTPLNNNAPYQLFQNQGNSNHWLQVDLQGLVSNRDGIGARVFATAGGITQLREQSSGINHQSQNHQRLHFGLGNNVNVEQLVVNFPSGRTLLVKNIPADQLVRVIEPGGSSKDNIMGGISNDIISGNGSNDTLTGETGNDYLAGNGGNDSLIGGSGNDQLWGSNGNDFLNGEQGRDFLNGGLGNDVFLLQPNRGADNITDFQDGQDKFQLTASLTFELLNIKQVNNNTQITRASNNQVLAILLNIDASTIDASDFI
ncbi:MAG: VCBS repeat-containing protein [Gomphosphaeria aponina SAG 52.96 = DSM 107014]|uniref:VCBS repeat-containing protein n=1 Tax=Gomphosphaeria aponina SAG 52.96 = DSM 107014 TaxID=1521640 RepID=A0A941JPI0_9CHRO|nr:VCBS repeat-containing protein [Gomphosphaeria aponina SAG 52.96 = DSM 107014]